MKHVTRVLRLLEARQITRITAQQCRSWLKLSVQKPNHWHIMDDELAECYLSHANGRALPEKVLLCCSVGGVDMQNFKYAIDYAKKHTTGWMRNTTLDDYGTLLAYTIPEGPGFTDPRTNPLIEISQQYGQHGRPGSINYRPPSQMRTAGDNTVTGTPDDPMDY